MPVPETQEVALSTGMTLYVDGKETTARPAAWPALVQLIRADGTTQHTVYLSASDPVPGAATPEIAQAGPSTEEKPAEAEPSDLPLPSESVLSSSLRTPLLGVAGTAVLTTAVLQILASRSAQTYWDDNTGVSELDDLRSRTNNLNSASVATGVISAGALATVSLTWEW